MVPMDEDVFTADDAQTVPETGSQTIVFDDDVVTEETFKKLTAGRLIPDGVYEFQVTNVKRIAPTAGKPGGDSVQLKAVRCLQGPAIPPEGLPPIYRTFKKFASPNDKQKVSEAIDKEDKAMLVKACGIEMVGPTINLAAAIQECKGRTVLATATQAKTDKGTLVQNVGRFRPIAG